MIEDQRNNAPRARVFISCGQAGELETAIKVKQALDELGFKPYLARQVQSAKALRENIFSELRETEYFLFIDFRRERIAGFLNRLYRGSLFSHQELAIASFLDLDILVFQEEGVKILDGMLGHIQGNAKTFKSKDRSNLPQLVKKEVAGLAWRNDWRNQLVAEQSDPPYGPLTRTYGDRWGYFFHLVVKNNHKRIAARNCYGYLRGIRDATTGNPVVFESVEYKWEGYMFPNATIAPGSYRKLDALWIDIDKPQRPNFCPLTDSSACIPVVQGPGSWELEYEVLSDNVPGSRLTLPLALGPNSGEIRFGTATLRL